MNSSQVKRENLTGENLSISIDLRTFKLVFPCNLSAEREHVIHVSYLCSDGDTCIAVTSLKFLNKHSCRRAAEEKELLTYLLSAKDSVNSDQGGPGHRARGPQGL